MSGRRRRDGERKDVGPGAGGPSEPRVQGAWDTPAVVVRAPDGSIVTPGERPALAPGSRTAKAPRPPGSRLVKPTPAAATESDDDAPDSEGITGDDGAGAQGVGEGVGSGGGRGERVAQAQGMGDGVEGGGGRPRVRPRRIPGAPGSVLVTPTLLPGAADGRAERRQRRLAAPTASVTALPPRRRRRGGGEGDEDAESEASPAALRPVGSGRGHASGRGARRPTPKRPGEPRTQRVLLVVAAINERLLPTDEEARQRRLARLRRLSMRLGSLTLAAMLIYAVFPVRTYLNQRAATQRAREQVEVLSQENDRLEQRAEDLRDPETVEEIARRELGLVMPGEESYGMLPAPEESATTTTVPSG